MLLREYATEWWFIIPPLLTNVSALPGETWTRKMCLLENVGGSEQNRSETLVRRRGIINHHLIAYSLSNISAKNYPNRLMWVESIVCNISVFFETQCKCEDHTDNIMINVHCRTRWLASGWSSEMLTARTDRISLSIRTSQSSLAPKSELVLMMLRPTCRSMFATMYC